MAAATRTIKPTIPLAVKVVYTLYVLVLTPVYFQQGGWSVFLWGCNVVMFGTLLALWLESSLLVSMMAVGSLPVGLAWLFDFLATLLLGSFPLNMADSMFNADRSLFMRALSLDHLWFPILLLWSLSRLGYDRRAWAGQCLLFSILLIATYFLIDDRSNPVGNVNWTFSHLPMGRETWLIASVLIMSIVAYAPTHLIMARLFPSCATRPEMISILRKNVDSGIA